MICRICSNDRNNRTYDVREMMFGFRERFTYFKCSRCGCLQIAAFPPDMSKYYPERYYAYVEADRGAPEAGWTPREAAKRLRNRYAVLRHGGLGRILHRMWPESEIASCIARHFPGGGVAEAGLTPKSRVLDVGCGAGELLRVLWSAGFPHLLGIDRYPAGHAMSRAPLIENRELRDVSGQWDLVMFHHSFEHLADPRDVLRSVIRLLAAGGACLIRVPVVSSHAWEHYGVDWVQLDAPRHFFLHTEDSLHRLAVDAGLEIQRVVHDSSAFQFFGSELYRRDIPLQPISPAEVKARTSAFTHDEIAAFEARARELNAERRGDQAAFYMRKRHQT